MVHLDSLTFTRSVYPFLRRPMRDSVHVSPDKWRDYRENHEFLNPSCLCALFQPQGEVLCYTEAAIYLPVMGLYSGEWVAECVKGRCGYLGKSLFPLALKIVRPYTTSPSTLGEALQEDWTPGQELPKKKCVADVRRC
jgi:hypothetical protein